MKTSLPRFSPARVLLAVGLVGTAAPTLAQTFTALAPSSVTAPAGAPLPGLSPEELQKFQDGRALYQHEFTPQEGLGPLFRARSCATCHGAPDIGGGDPTGENNVLHYTLSNNGAFYQAFEIGGPVQQHLSIAGMPGTQCQLAPDTLPTQLHGLGTSIRHSPPVFGFGLLDAVADADILSWEGRRPWKKPGVLGASNWGVELEGLEPLQDFSLDRTRTQPYGASRVGRFGWKAQNATLFQFTTEPFNTELGVTTPFSRRENAPDGTPLPPECLIANQPNDVNSQLSLRLFYFQAFLAAPERGPITPAVQAGEALFRETGCADCHRETLRTVDDYHAPWPDGTAHRVAALSGKVIRPYTDLLIHDMGPGLADVRPMGRASGRFWRTTPLWGLRHKTRYLHDGSANTVEDAILMHGGEGTWSREAYLRLTPEERALLKAFLDSL
jgi:CxxC motif-containing protein (DUF1111 family)